MNTMRAPNAKALNTSLPLRTPPSMYTSTLPPMARTMLGSATNCVRVCMGAGLHVRIHRCIDAV
jgi:hypothetical protein